MTVRPIRIRFISDNMPLVQLASEWFELLRQGFTQTEDRLLIITDDLRHGIHLEVRLIRTSPADDLDRHRLHPEAEDIGHQGDEESNDEFDDVGVDDADLTQLVVGTASCNSVPIPQNLSILKDQEHLSSSSTQSSSSLPNPTVPSPSLSGPPSRDHAQRTRRLRHHRNRRKTLHTNLRAKRPSPRQEPCQKSSTTRSSVALLSDSEPEDGLPNQSQDSEEDEAIAWIQHTPTQDSKWPPESMIGYSEAQYLYRMARAIGDHSVYECWKRIFCAWRSEGRPMLSLLVGLDHDTPVRIPEHLRAMRQQIVTLYQAFQAVEQTEAHRDLQQIAYRRNAAWLFASYGEAETVLAQSLQQRRPHGMTDRAYVKQTLFYIMHPHWASISKPHENSATKKAWKMMDNRLNYGSRWHHLRQELGEGIFYVLPNILQYRKLIERTLSIKRLHFWTRIVQHVNARGVAMGQDLIQAIGQLRQTKCMPTKALAIERYSFSELETVLVVEGPFQTLEEGQRTSGDERRIETPKIVTPEFDSATLALLHHQDWDGIIANESQYLLPDPTLI